MANDRTRTFIGQYSSKDGKNDKVTVRIFKRFASMGLALSLIHSVSSRLPSIRETWTAKDGNI